jgi:lysophospholipase L1-like esterase
MIFHKHRHATPRSRSGWCALLLLAALSSACGDSSSEAESPIGIGGSGGAGAAAGGGGTSGAAGSVASGAAGTNAGAGASGRSGGFGRPAGSSGASAAGSTAGSAAGATAPVPAAGSTAGAAAGGGAAGAAAAASAGQAGAAAGTGAAAPGTDYKPCPAADVCKILPLGDSITYGIGFNGGYRVELFRKAQADGKKITFTGSLSNGPNMVDGVTFPKNNEGHSGWKIDQLLPLIPMPALQQVPHIVLLMIGTNDIAQNDNLANAPKRLGGLIDKLVTSAPDALIVVAQLTPLSRSTAVQTYNTAIPAIVQERAAAGKHVTMVDQFAGFPTSELGDGVHPNEQGYNRMAGVWYQAIGKLLP